MHSGYTILEHPADLGIEARGTTVREAFQLAAAALMSIILDTSGIDEREQRDMHITATDRDNLLVKFMSEVLYLYDGLQFASKSFVIQELTGTNLRATAHGEPFSGEKHQTRLDVKAVTYHQLLIKEDSDQAIVRVYLDI